MRSYREAGDYASELRQFTSEHDLLDHAARYSSDYHNPYLQTITPTPTSEFSSGKQGPGAVVPGCHNIIIIFLSFPPSGHLSPSYRNVGGLGRDEGRYLSGRENALLSRLHQGHLADLSSEQRNQTSIGTHV